MFSKYFKLILFSTVLLQASPKIFNSLGNELEAFQEDCKVFQETSVIPVKIKKKCKTFNSQITKAFKVGYKLDPYIDSDNISEKKLNKYLGLLRNLDSSKENILNLMYSEAKKARKQNDIKNYSQLIENHKIKLYSSDYEFMENNKDSFVKNERYLAHLEFLKYVKEASQKNLELKNKRAKERQGKTLKKKKKVEKKNLPLFVKRTDFVRVLGHMNKGFLDATVFYQNRDSGERVFWENNEALIKCKAYENISDMAYPKKGRELGSIKKKTKRDGQSFYIKMKPTDKKNGILECSVNLHGKILTDKSSFLTREQ